MSMTPYKTGPWTAVFFLVVVFGGALGNWLGYPLVTVGAIFLLGFVGLVYYYYRRAAATA